MTHKMLSLGFVILLIRPTPATASKYDDLRREAAKAIAFDGVVGSKPKITESQNSLIVDPGDVKILGVGAKNEPAFRALQWQLDLDLLRQEAFTSDVDKTAAGPIFAKIEDHIQREVELIAAARGNTTDANTQQRLAEHDATIADLFASLYDAVAKARGLNRAFVSKEAHPGWVVTIIAPPGTVVRYTPYLNFLLNEAWPDKLDWTTATNGDKVRLRGKYQVELLRDGRTVKSLQPKITDTSSTINFGDR
jgi:hypothetical protein